MVLKNANQENQFLGRIPKMAIIGFVDNESLSITAGDYQVVRPYVKAANTQETIPAFHSDFGITMQNLQPVKLMDNHIQLKPFSMIFWVTVRIPENIFNVFKLLAVS